MPLPPNADHLLETLIAFQDFLKSRILKAMDSLSVKERTGVTQQTAADTLFGIDVAVEGPALEWLDSHWPQEIPVQLVMEGVEDGTRIVPAGVRVAKPDWILIIDPIDGTRPYMHLKRSAWILAGLAPAPAEGGTSATLESLQLGAMTELPLPNAAWSEQFSAVRGRGLVANQVFLESGEKRKIACSPSSQESLAYGFAGLFRGIPQGRVLSSRIEASFYDLVFGKTGREQPLLFEDQYISTGGQLYGLMTGRDLMVADLRPLIFRKLGLSGALACHPYDLAALPVAREAGIIVRGWEHEALLNPLNSVASVGWVGYANEALYHSLHPLLVEAVASIL